MSFRRLFAAVAQYGRMPAPEDVWSALSAFFRTLSERIQGRDALLLASAQPTELASLVLSPPRAHGEVFTLEEFLFRMRVREHTSREVAERHARVIGAVLGAQLPPRTMSQLRDALPVEFHSLFEPLIEGGTRVMPAPERE